MFSTSGTWTPDPSIVKQECWRFNESGTSTKVLFSQFFLTEPAYLYQGNLPIECPDRQFHNIRASRAGDRRFLCSSETSDLGVPKLWKGRSGIEPTLALAKSKNGSFAGTSTGKLVVHGKNCKCTNFTSILAGFPSLNPELQHSYFHLFFSFFPLCLFVLPILDMSLKISFSLLLLLLLFLLLCVGLGT